MDSWSKLGMVMHMNTEAQRARNARKRAKLKAHKRGTVETTKHEQKYLYEFAVRGNKNPFPPEAEDAGFLDPILPRWALATDCIEVSVEGPASLYQDLSALKHTVREKVEDMYGFNKHDLCVLLENVILLP